MRQAAIIGLTRSGTCELVCGILPYSEARAKLSSFIQDERFQEIHLCEPSKRYRPTLTPEPSPEPKSKSKK